MIAYEDAGTALSGGALTAETLDFAVGVNLVILQDGHLDLLALVLDLLWGLDKANNGSKVADRKSRLHTL